MPKTAEQEPVVASEVDTTEAPPESRAFASVQELQDAIEEERNFGILSKQPRVRILLPRTPGAEKDPPVEVYLNGVPYIIARGVSVEVPEDIAAVLRHANMI